MTKEEIQKDIETQWLLTRADLVKLKTFLERESPGMITEQVRAINSLVSAMVKRRESLGN